MSPPDLSEIIIAGVEPEWRRTANTRALGLALGRIVLVLVSFIWVFWAVQLLGDAGGLVPEAADGATIDPGADPTSANLLIDAAAYRLAIALSLLAAAWKPRLVAGLMPMMGALWTFKFGFLVRDIIVGTVEEGQVLGLLLLLGTLMALSWTWLNDYGYSRLRAGWRELGANPV
ncbi:hypothetical protein [Corynebacterium alimapuense]|nr:hypothetical protein [Corynebacterium alimapuense]